MEDVSTLTCKTCGHIGFTDGYDGFFYCQQCGLQADDIMDTGVADEDFIDKGGGDAGGGLYQAVHTRKLAASQPVTQQDSLHSQFWSQLTQEQKKPEVDGPTDFAPEETEVVGLVYEDYYEEVRSRYVLGVQIMAQLQCEALVERFKVTPLIGLIMGPIWLRFVAATGVCDEDWADNSINESEQQMKEEDEEEVTLPKRNKAGPHNLYGRRAVSIWLTSLRNTIPLACSLAVSFLACHIARESILPNDIRKWAIEGKVPYFSAFVDIGKQMGDSSRACPISASVMFKAHRVVSAQKLESLAAIIAQTIGLSLPPVNFYGIASRYLKDLSLPVDVILPQAYHLQEWAMQPDLYLSTNPHRLPTRVCVMSLLMVTIRILYNIQGFGIWERSFSDHTLSSLDNDEEAEEEEKSTTVRNDDAEVSSDSSDSPIHGLDTKCKNREMRSRSEAEDLLKHLEAKYRNTVDTFEYSKELKSYLGFCKDVVFASGEQVSLDNEYKTVEDLWSFYQNEKDFVTTQSLGDDNSRDNIPNGARSVQNEDERNATPSNDTEDVHSLKDEAIRRLKLDMERNRFSYIPPRVDIKREDHLHYVRKKDEGGYAYVAHADYYIVLRACASVAQVDMRVMHYAALSLERRLGWIEKRIDHSLHLTPPIMTCEFCTDMPESPENDVADEFMDLHV